MDGLDCTTLRQLDTLQEGDSKGFPSNRFRKGKYDEAQSQVSTTLSEASNAELLKRLRRSQFNKRGKTIIPKYLKEVSQLIVNISFVGLPRPLFAALQATNRLFTVPCR